MRVLLARHGETPWNAEGRYQGQMDIALSDNGERQARSSTSTIDSPPAPASAPTTPCWWWRTMR